MFADGSDQNGGKTQQPKGKKKKGGAARGGSIEIPDHWSDDRRAVMGEWFAHRLGKGRHITPAQFEELVASTAQLSDAQLRACIEDAIPKGQLQLQPHKFAGAQRDMFTPTDLTEDIYRVYPLKTKKPNAIRAINKALRDTKMDPRELLHRTELYAAAVARWPEEARYTTAGRDTVPHPATWFNGRCFLDDPATWEMKPQGYAQKKEGGAVPESPAVAAPIAEVEPEDWESAWDSLYDFARPASWREVPAGNRTEILHFLRTR